MSTWAYWRAVIERAASTFLEAFIPLVGSGPLTGLDWPEALGLAGSAAFLSVLKSLLAGLRTGGPSVGGQETLGD
ncbi:MAG: holin [Propionibacteriaceae bacterium]|nr:holin [Propionibacteriaceae bacterium]